MTYKCEQDCLDDELHNLGLLAVPTPSAIVVMSNERAAALMVQANLATTAIKWKI